MELRKKAVLTIECRMNSSRLPGKVLLEALPGCSMLEYMVNRIRRAQFIDSIVLATTTNSLDDSIESLGKKLNVSVWRGSEHDVLKRVLDAAKQNSADIIVELCGDCPVLDPRIVDEVISKFLKSNCDYCSNIDTGYPDGMDVQVFTIESLKRADLEGKSSEDREHVSWYIRNHPEIFRHESVVPKDSQRAPDIRVTLDEPGDEIFLRRIMKYFEENRNFTCEELIEFIRSDAK